MSSLFSADQGDPASSTPVGPTPVVVPSLSLLAPPKPTCAITQLCQHALAILHQTLRDNDPSLVPPSYSASQNILLDLCKPLHDILKTRYPENYPSVPDRPPADGDKILMWWDCEEVEHPCLVSVSTPPPQDSASPTSDSPTKLQVTSTNGSFLDVFHFDPKIDTWRFSPAQAFDEFEQKYDDELNYISMCYELTVADMLKEGWSSEEFERRIEEQVSAEKEIRRTYNGDLLLSSLISCTLVVV